MKTYEETVWRLALAQAHKYYAGYSDTRVEDLDTVAWIYGVTVNTLFADMKIQEKDAYNFALKGTK